MWQRFSGNILSFGADNSTSPHVIIAKTTFLVLSEGPVGEINGSIGTLEKSLVKALSMAKTKFYSSLNYNGVKSYLFFNGIEIFSYKVNNRKVNFPNQFYLGSIKHF